MGGVKVAKDFLDLATRGTGAVANSHRPAWVACHRPSPSRRWQWRPNPSVSTVIIRICGPRAAIHARQSIRGWLVVIAASLLGLDMAQGSAARRFQSPACTCSGSSVPPKPRGTDRGRQLASSVEVDIFSGWQRRNGPLAIGLVVWYTRHRPLVVISTHQRARFSLEPARRVRIVSAGPLAWLTICFAIVDWADKRRRSASWQREHARSRKVVRRRFFNRFWRFRHLEPTWCARFSPYEPAHQSQDAAYADTWLCRVRSAQSRFWWKRLVVDIEPGRDCSTNEECRRQLAFLAASEIAAVTTLVRVRFHFSWTGEADGSTGDLQCGAFAARRGWLVGCDR